MKLQPLQASSGRSVRVEAVAPPLPTTSSGRAGTAAAGPTPSSIMDYAMSKPQAWPKRFPSEQAPPSSPRPYQPRSGWGPEMDGASKQPNRHKPAGDSLPQRTGLSVLWLGTSSGAPTGHRNVSCTVVQMPGAVFLVDCGEGSHRQLQEANIDLSKVEGVLITHLHGDHCFGLATALQMIDNAKCEALAAPEPSSSGAGRSAAAAITHVYGPPGLIDLLRVSLALTGEEHRLHTRISVTELVLDAPGAQPSGLGGSSDEGWDAVAAWDSEKTSSQPGQEAPQPMVSAHRLGSLLLSDSPSLSDAAESVQRRINSLPSIWRPSHYLQQAATARSQQRRQRSQSLDSSDSDEAEYHGLSYIASFGRYWDLPFRHARVRAAQLQHRVPCWGYVFEELLPAQQPEQQPQAQRAAGSSRAAAELEYHNGMLVGRKVVILGDTICSAAVAPLALNCDVISHEATFMAGMEVTCRQAQHSTAYLAGAFAHFVQAKHLVLTHFSGRYAPSGPVRRHQQGGRHASGGRSGGRSGGNWRERPVPEEEEEAEQSQAIACLIREARRYFGAGSISAAHDFFMVHVQKQRGWQDS